jgi:biopolymer transport protein ExbD
MSGRRFQWQRSLDGEDSSSAIDLTPLIDMVFILLIFFLVTSSFIRESAIQVERPKAATAAEADQAGAIVTLTTDGQVWLNDTLTDVHYLRPGLEQLRLGSDDAVVILADTATPTGQLVRVMDQIRLAGLTNISVAASMVPEKP